MVDKVCKKLGTRCFPPGAKRDKLGEAYAMARINPKICWFYQKYERVGWGLNSFSIIEKYHDPLSSSSGQEEEEFYKEEHKSLQGDYMEEEKEGGCTSKIFGGDMKIANKDVGSCMDEDTYFG